MVRKTVLKCRMWIYLILAPSISYNLYFIYSDLISSLLDPRLVNPGSTFIHVDAYDCNL